MATAFLGGVDVASRKTVSGLWPNRERFVSRSRRSPGTRSRGRAERHSADPRTNVRAMRASTEFWTSGVGLPRSTVKQAKRAEDEGWDGIGLVDSQNLAGDPYVELALAAHATTGHATQRIQLGTAVTNPLTRHPAAMATAIATVQAESDGRAVLGIGRGDSALAHLGLAPAPVPSFERYLARLQGYLRGEDVPFAVELDGGGEVKPADALHLAGGPKASRLRWLRDGFTKVPVDVAATGPKVMHKAAAAHAAEGMVPPDTPIASPSPSAPTSND